MFTCLDVLEVITVYMSMCIKDYQWGFLFILFMFVIFYVILCDTIRVYLSVRCITGSLFLGFHKWL